MAFSANVGCRDMRAKGQKAILTLSSTQASSSLSHHPAKKSTMVTRSPLPKTDGAIDESLEAMSEQRQNGIQQIKQLRKVRSVEDSLLENAEQDWVKKEETISTLQKELGRSVKHNGDQAVTISKVQDEIKDKDKEMETKRNDLCEMDVAIKNNDTYLATCEKKQNELETTINEHMATINSLPDETRTREQQLHEKDSAIYNQKNTIDCQKTQISNLHELHRNMDTMVKQHLTTIKGNNETIRVRDRTLNMRDQQLEEKDERIRGLQKDLGECVIRERDYKASMGSQQDELDKLKEQAQRQSDKDGKLEELLKDLGCGNIDQTYGNHC